MKTRMSFAVAAAAAAVIGLVAVGGAPAPAVEEGPIGTGHGVFYTPCSFSHRAQDDPIVFFGEPGKSHSHDFFCNVSTDANSTNADLLRYSSTARREDEVKDLRHGVRVPRIPTNRSAYWVPTLYVNDQRVTANDFSAFYTAGRRDFQAIEPFPVGLRMIAGDSKGLDPQEQNGIRVWFWACQGGEAVPGDFGSDAPPTCNTPDLRLTIRFPDCWDGHNLDSLNHKSHMAYSEESGGAFRCPSDHPVLMPILTLQLRYPTTAGPTTRVATGSGATASRNGLLNAAHADEMNGWATNPDTGMNKLDELVRDCLNVDRYCGGQSTPVPGH